MSHFEYVPGTIPPAVVHLPSYEEFEVSKQTMLDAFPETHRHIDKIMRDPIYWTIKLIDYSEVILEAILDMPKYIKHRFDCDDIAGAIVYRIKERYKYNSIFLVDGMWYELGHSWNMFYTFDAGWMQFNGNTFCEMDEKGLRPYRLDSV